MEEVTYILRRHDSVGTSNVNNLIIGDRDRGYPIKALVGLNPESLEQAFGPGVDIDIPSKGYTDPEWYWKSSDDCVWGIGWRWGQPRLRGKGPITAEKAEHFLDFLRGSLEAANMTDREVT